MKRARVAALARIAILVRTHSVPLTMIVAAVALYGVRQAYLRAGEEGSSFTIDAGMTGVLLAYCIPLALGGVCREMTQGYATLWLQKPIHPLRFYLARFLEAGFAAVALPVLISGGVAVGVMLFARTPTGVHEWGRALPSMVLLSVVLISVGFGFSGLDASVWPSCRSGVSGRLHSSGDPDRAEHDARRIGLIPATGRSSSPSAISPVGFSAASRLLCRRFRRTLAASRVGARVCCLVDAAGNGRGTPRGWRREAGSVVTV